MDRYEAFGRHAVIGLREDPDVGVCLPNYAQALDVVLAGTGVIQIPGADTQTIDLLVLTRASNWRDVAAFCNVCFPLGGRGPLMAQC